MSIRSLPGRRRRPGVVLAASELDQAGPGERGALGGVVGRVDVEDAEDLRREVGHLRAEHRDRVARPGLRAVDHERVAHVLRHRLQRADDVLRGLGRVVVLVGMPGTAGGAGLEPSPQPGGRALRAAGEVAVVGHRVERLVPRLGADVVRELLVDDRGRRQRVVLVVDLAVGLQPVGVADLFCRYVSRWASSTSKPPPLPKMPPIRPAIETTSASVHFAGRWSGAAAT